MSYEEKKIYDLDTDWKLNKSFGFSLTICNQVLEHVFNPHLAFSNLCHSTKKNGYIWVSIPTVNCIHGQPQFYSSGYHPRFPQRLASEFGLKTISIGKWGTKKYMLNALIGKWLFSDYLKKGIHRKGDLLFPFEIFKDGRLQNNSENPEIITDCWGLFRKI